MINASRLKLHTELMLILKSNNVYFQPPESIKINYPAIIYSRMDVNNVHADDNIYNQKVSYKVTIVDEDPDSEIVERMAQFKYASFDRHYTANGLNHDQFTVVY